MLQDANELLQDGKEYMLIFTEGYNLDLNASDGKAYSGWWRMSG